MVGGNIFWGCFFIPLFTFGALDPFVVFLHRKRGVVLEVLRTPTYGYISWLCPAEGRLAKESQWC